MTEDVIEYDLLIVGAGPAGLSCAIHYANLCKRENKNVSVCILEKGANVGAHLLSGAAFDPIALNELLPDWPNRQLAINTPVTEDKFYFLSAKKAWPLPVPNPLQNKGNFIISLGQFCQTLAKEAENLGIEIYCGFTGSALLYNDKEEVIGIQTGDKGRDKNGEKTAQFQAGIKILAKQTLLAEGCRGYLSQQIIEKYALNKHKSPQIYGIGLKEIWEIPMQIHHPGKIIHSIGWPLKNEWGGSFLYYWGKNLLSLGIVIALDYQNPYLNPYLELQRFKHHPFIAPLLKNGRCLSYGSRALNEGGWQSLPELSFPGGMLIGDSAGFLNAARIKGTHTAMKSGMLAAEAAFEHFQKETTERKIAALDKKVETSWIATELKKARNIRPAFRAGLLPGLLYAAFDTYILRGYAPWTFSHGFDHKATKPANQCQPIHYPKPDGILSFDKMTALRLSNVFHRENQANHLKLIDPEKAIEINWRQYAGFEQYYCPAGVYEYIETESGYPKLQINASNCIHCKTCDIKDPTQNIRWTPPEGGDGPNYSNM